LSIQFLTLNKDYAGHHIQGERDYQEDYFRFDNSRANDFLMILADGMGGYEGGAVASSCAVETFMDSYHIAKGSAAERLQQALQKTNLQLALEKPSKPKLANMGCTLVGAAIHRDQLEWISVGDSPLWLYKAGRLHRLNADHSMKPILQKQVQRGELTPKIAAAHPERNMLRSALTGAKIELIDQSSVPLKLLPGARILLASDGIFTLSESEIRKILRKDLSAQKLVNQLLAAVHKKGKKYQDNTTALVVKIPDEQDAVKKPWRWQTSVLLSLLILSLIIWTSDQFRMINWPDLITCFSKTSIAVPAERQNTEDIKNQLGANSKKPSEEQHIDATSELQDKQPK